MNFKTRKKTVCVTTTIYHIWVERALPVIYGPHLSRVKACRRYSKEYLANVDKEGELSVFVVSLLLPSCCPISPNLSVCLSVCLSVSLSLSLSLSLSQAVVLVLLMLLTYGITVLHMDFPSYSSLLHDLWICTIITISVRPSVRTLPVSENVNNS